MAQQQVLRYINKSSVYINIIKSFDWIKINYLVSIWEKSAYIY